VTGESAARSGSAGRCAQGEEGFAGGFGGLAFGLLLFVVGTLLVATAWGVIDTKVAVDASARQAARTYVEAPDASAAGAAAVEAADATLRGYGRRPSLASVRVLAGGFARCERITIEVSYPAPLVVLPWIGRVGIGVPVSARHSEIVDPFRSGLMGVSSCP
jgi:hypothetical protein